MFKCRHFRQFKQKRCRVLKYYYFLYLKRKCFILLVVKKVQNLECCNSCKWASAPEPAYVLLS